MFDTGQKYLGPPKLATSITKIETLLRGKKEVKIRGRTCPELAVSSDGVRE